MPKLHIYKNEKETCHAFADWLTELVNETLKTQDRFTIALSGGDTPKLLYKILSTEYADKLDWSKIHVFWGEEKFASQTNDKDSSTALKACIDHVPVPKDQIHTISTKLSPEESAKQYDELLRSCFNDEQKTFDLVILVMGEEGNLLSLLPNNEENNHPESWVLPVYDQQEDVYKVTLNIPAINAASVKAFLVVGKKKEDVVQQVLKGKYDPGKYPAQLVITANKQVHWFLDEGAAGKLIRPIS